MNMLVRKTKEGEVPRNLLKDAENSICPEPIKVGRAVE